MRLPHYGSMKVNPVSGAFCYYAQDISIPCRGGMRIVVSRSYDSTSETDFNDMRGFAGWNFNFDERLCFEYSGHPRFVDAVPLLRQKGVEAILLPDGEDKTPTLSAVTVTYADWSKLRFVYENGAFVPASSSITSSLRRDADGTFTLTLPGAGTHVFRSDGKLIAMEDLCGNRITYAWSTPSSLYEAPKLLSITDPSGRSIRITHTSTSRTFTDWTGRQWQYGLDSMSRLVSYTDPEGNSTRYGYESFMGFPPEVSIPTLPGLEPLPPVPMYLSRVAFPNGEYLLCYQAGDRPLTKRVGALVLGHRLAIRYVYDFEKRQTTVLHGDAEHVTVYRWDAQGGYVEVADPLENVYANTYDAQGNVTMNIDPRLGKRTFAYDGQSRLVSQTDSLGFSRSFVYDPSIERVTRIDAPGNDGPVASSMSYDPRTARRLSETNALGETVSYGYDAYGHATTVTLQDGTTCRYTYDLATGLVRTRTDPMGNVTTYEHDSLGCLLSVITPEGRTARFTYNRMGQVTSVTAPDGAVSRLVYDGNYNRVKSVDALGHETAYAYNVLNELIQVTDAMGRMIQTAYGPRGEVISTTDVEGRTTRYTYDLRGRLIRTDHPDGTASTTAYEAYCGTMTRTDSRGLSTETYQDMLCRVTRTVDAAGLASTATYNPDGTTQATTDPLGNRSTYGYDSLGRTISATDALGNTTRTTYDARGNVATETDARGNTTRYTYDGLDRLVQVTYADGSTEKHTYDRDGLQVAHEDRRGKVWKTLHDDCGRPFLQVDPLGNKTRTIYDALGRVTRSISPMGSTVKTKYDAQGQPVSFTDPLGNVSQRVFDPNGRLVAVVDPLGRIVRTVYDDKGQTVGTIDAMGNRTTLVRDTAGQVVKVIDANGNATSYEYDAFGRQTAEIYADGSRVTSAYDAYGNLVTRTDPRGFVTSYLYDGFNRLSQVVPPDSPPVTFTYDSTGSLVQRQDGTGTYSFAYDAEGRVVELTQPDGSRYQFSYDVAGNRTRVIFPDGRQQVLTYDDLGRTKTLQGPDNVPLVYSYDADGRHVRTAYPNGTTAQMEYDQAGRLVRQVHQDSAGVNLTPDFRLSYDAAGNIVEVTDGTAPFWSYAYDRLNQLVSATDHRSATTTAWAYDAVGNRLTQTVDGTTTNYAYNNLNQLLRAGDEELFYDPAGNLAGKVSPSGVTRYLFDSRNRLTDVLLPDATGVHYGYDSDGRMTRRTDAGGTTRLDWSGWDAVRETAPDGSVTRYFLKGSKIDSFQRDEEHYRLHTDWLGSVRAVSDRSGAKVATFDYGPWGDELPGNYDNVTGGVPMRFVGGYGVRWDNDCRLHYMRKRWYSPAIHFLSVDPYPSRDARSAYAYAANHPLIEIDPDGAVSVKIIALTHARTDRGPNVWLFRTYGKFFRTNPTSLAGSVSLTRTPIADVPPILTVNWLVTLYMLEGPAYHKVFDQRTSDPPIGVKTLLPNQEEVLMFILSNLKPCKKYYATLEFAVHRPLIWIFNELYASWTDELRFDTSSDH